MKKQLLTIFGLMLAGLSFAQEPAAATVTNDPEQLYRIMSIVLFSFVGLIFLIAMIYMVKVNSMLTKELIQAKLGTPEASLEAKSLAEKLDYWSSFKKKYWEDAVPMEYEEDVMFHHSYDGIRELDNKLPPWWVNLFYVTIVFACGYLYWYTFSDNGKSQTEEYEMAVAKGEEVKMRARAAQANLVDENNLKLMTDPAMLAQGELTFKNLCAACHGQAGEGGVGPNMTDEYWIHGGSIQNIYSTIKNGVPDKGMISWSAQLSPSDMLKVGSYLKTLKGTNPPNPKAPQGTIYTEEAVSDSTAVKEAGVK